MHCSRHKTISNSLENRLSHRCRIRTDDIRTFDICTLTKNYPPDFGLLFLAQFARFSIRTETKVPVHTHSQTNRHLHRCPAQAFGSFVLLELFNARRAGSTSDPAQRASG